MRIERGRWKNASLPAAARGAGRQPVSPLVLGSDTVVRVTATDVPLIPVPAAPVGHDYRYITVDRGRRARAAR